MLSEFSRKAKRATVLTGTVAAAALLMGAGAANALMIDNFGGRHISGSTLSLGAISHIDGDGTAIGYAAVTRFTQNGDPAGLGNLAGDGAVDQPGGSASSETTSPCAGAGGGGGDFAWCIGGGSASGRLMVVNARGTAVVGGTATSLTSSINMTDLSVSTAGRPDGVFRHTDTAGGSPDSYGETTLFYGGPATDGVVDKHNGTTGPGTEPGNFPGTHNLLIKEDIDSNIFGSDPEAGGVLSYGNTTLESITNAGTDAEKAAEIGMWGFIIKALTINVEATELDILVRTDSAVDLGFGAASSHTITFELPFTDADPDGVDIFIPFSLFVADDTDQAQLLALIDGFSAVRALQFQIGGPDGATNNQVVLEEIRTGMQNLPEPGTLAVMGMGLIGLGIARRRRAQKAA